MLISEFAREAGLTVDTVRFYVRRGLLTPETNGKGGSNPYQVFTAEHLRAARFIRTAQSLGMSLKELAAIGAQRRAGTITPEFSMEVLSRQLEKLERKMSETRAMTRYLRAKIAWIADGEQGTAPDFASVGPNSIRSDPVGCRPRRRSPAC